jgi:hypothetical protein
MKDDVSLPGLNASKKTDGTLYLCVSNDDCTVRVTLDAFEAARLRAFLNISWPAPEWWAGEAAAEEHKKRESERVESLGRLV